MNIWIVNPYGTLPSEGWREYRSSMLARALTERGHRPTWFLSNFEHRSKTYREGLSSDPALPGVAIHCLPATPYSRNISIARIRYEQSFGRAFAAISSSLPKPDAIVLAEPSLFFGDPVRRFARDNAIPLIVDILDLWPEMFSLAVPKPVRRLATPLFAPLYARRRRLLREAAGVVGCTTGYAVMARAVTDRPVETVYLGVDVADLRRAMTDIPAHRQLPVFDGLTCVYAGTLGEAYDIPCLAAAVERIAAAGRIRIVIAGAGPEKVRLETLAKRYPQTLIFLGELTSEELGAIYAQSQIGLCSYAPDSAVEMPVKLFDYLAAGLGFITSLDGEIRHLIDAGAGKYCKAGDPDSLADLLSHMSQNPASIRSMQDIAGSLALKFDKYGQHNMFVDFIETLCENNPRAPA